MEAINVHRNGCYPEGVSHNAITGGLVTFEMSGNLSGVGSVLQIVRFMMSPEGTSWIVRGDSFRIAVHSRSVLNT